MAYSPIVFKFHKKGIAVGETLVCLIDPSSRGIVVDDSHIEVAGSRRSLSSATLEVLKAQGKSRSSIQGTRFWSYNGVAVADLPDIELPGHVIDGAL